MFCKLRRLGALLLLAVAAPMLPASAQAKEKDASSAAASDTLRSLNGNWQFALAPTPADAEEMKGFQLPSFDAAQFRPTPVPSNWAMLGYEKPQYKSFKGDASEGFYRHQFSIPQEWKGRRLLLHFEGVWSSAEVWLNGKHLGRHDSGFTEASFDISRAAKIGGENLLAVRVRQTQPDYQFDTNDDWTIGGIYRNVTLESMPSDRWIDRVEATTDFDHEYRDADLRVRVMIADTNKKIPPGNFMYPGGEGYNVRLSLFDAAGKLVKAQDVPVEAHLGTGRETIATLHVEKPLQWTAETPNLYRLSVELVNGGRVTHSRSVRVGFREISTAGGVLRVNGQAIKLRGVNRHDEHPDTGRATTPAQWRQDIELMKAANINYIRLAHYPPAKGFIDLADEMGMYLSNEISYGYGGNHMNDPVYAGAAMLRNYQTVERDINHPSIIIWTVGNEDPMTTLHLASLRMVKGLDPTRPLLMPWRAETWLPPEIDILSPHYWTAAKYDELGAKADRPIISTEWSHAFGNEGFGGMDERWKALTRHPAGAGGAIWLWADQALKLKRRRPDGSEESYLELTDDGFDGITDAYRNPTRDYWEAKAVYAPVYPVIEKAEVVPGQPSVRVPIQNDYDFTDLDKIQIGWTLVEEDRPLASGTTSITGRPHTQSWLEIPLTALGEAKSETFYGLRLRFLRADGSDIGERSVELVRSLAPPAPASTMARPVVETDGDRLSVRVGEAQYGFDPRTGLLASAAFAGEPRLIGTKPTIWRPMNASERIIIKSEGGFEDLPDLNAYRANVSRWKVDQKGEAVLIDADVEYVVDAKNRFSVAYHYEVRPTGELHVRYSIRPKVQAKWLPYAGIELQLAPGLDHLRWLGLGPLDAFPNEKRAPMLGVWNQALGREDGMKSIRWARVTEAGGKGLRVRENGYINFSAGEPDRLRLLSSVLGRPTKGWRPEDPSYRLDTDTNEPLVGAFVLDMTR